MTTKFGKMVTSLEQLPFIALLDPLIKQFFKIAWQTKAILSPLLQCQWLPNLAVLGLTLRDSYLYSHMALWSSDLSRSDDELEALYLCHHGTPTHKVIWSSNHVVLWVHVRNYIIYISACTDHNAYGNQTFQGYNILRGAPTHEFPWPVSEVFLWGHVTT